mgnify:CR=1 FL=1
MAYLYSYLGYRHPLIIWWWFAMCVLFVLICFGTDISSCTTGFAEGGRFHCLSGDHCHIISGCVVLRIRQAIWIVKCVSFNPRSFTRLFINPTKLLILPEMCSATARHTSLADSSMIAFKHCSTDNFRRARKNSGAADLDAICSSRWDGYGFIHGSIFC